MAAEDRGPLMHARIGMLRALNRNVVRVFNPDRKDKHWGTAQAGEGPMRPPRAVAPPPRKAVAAQTERPPEGGQLDCRCRLRGAYRRSGAPSSSSEVMGDAKYCDAGQDQKRHCASYAAP